MFNVNDLVSVKGEIGIVKAILSPKHHFTQKTKYVLILKRNNGFRIWIYSEKNITKINK